MQGLRKSLEGELAHLQAVKEKLESAPNMGDSEQIVKTKAVRMTHCRGAIRYYLKKKNQPYEYVQKKDMPEVQKIIQAQYHTRVYKQVNMVIKQIHQLLRIYSDDGIDRLYDGLPIGRRKLVTPVEETREQKYKSWLAEEYKGKEFGENTPVILTEKGERVRSKSEKIIADFLYRHGIEYKYEKPLYLKGIGIVYPDFTLWSYSQGKEIYWEHDGKMDDANYAKAAVKKINTYIHNDIFPSDRLIITYETTSVPLNMEAVNKMLCRYL